MAVDIPESTVTIGSIIGGLVAVGSGMLYARRKISRDSVELNKDRAEIDIISTLTQQRDEAIHLKRQARADITQAELDKQVALARVTQLENELHQLRQRVTLLKELVTRLSSALDLTRSQLAAIAAQTKRPITSREKDSRETHS